MFDNRGVSIDLPLNSSVYRLFYTYLIENQNNRQTASRSSYNRRHGTRDGNEETPDGEHSEGNRQQQAASFHIDDLPSAILLRKLLGGPWEQIVGFAGLGQPPVWGPILVIELAIKSGVHPTAAECRIWRIRGRCSNGPKKNRRGKLQLVKSAKLVDERIL